MCCFLSASQRLTHKHRALEEKCGCLVAIVNVWSCDQFGLNLVEIEICPPLLREEEDRGVGGVTLQWMLIIWQQYVSIQMIASSYLRQLKNVHLRKKSAIFLVVTPVGREGGGERGDKEVWEAFLESVYHRCFTSLWCVAACRGHAGSDGSEFTLATPVKTQRLHISVSEHSNKPRNPTVTYAQNHCLRRKQHTRLLCPCIGHWNKKGRQTLRLSQASLWSCRWKKHEASNNFQARLTC